VIQRLRVPLGFAVAAAVIALATPTMVSIAAGLPIALIGAVFRALAAGVIKKDARLATSGPYGWSRNPLYFGSSLLALGFAVMSWNVFAAALLLAPSAIVYPNVIRSEETHLERLFGDEFRAYRSAVPRFFPKIQRLTGSFSFHQYLANREYNTAIGFLGALFAFILKTLW